MLVDSPLTKKLMSDNKKRKTQKLMLKKEKTFDTKV